MSKKNKTMKGLKGSANVILAWLGSVLKQNTSAYCEIQTADSPTVLVANDGSLLSIIRIDGVMNLIGREEFKYIKTGVQQSLQSAMSKEGQLLQVYFGYDKTKVTDEITEVFSGAKDTADRIGLSLDDLFEERVDNLSKYCAFEEAYIVLWTKVSSLSSDQLKNSNKFKSKMIKEGDIPPFNQTQNLMATVIELRESHDSIVKLFFQDLKSIGIVANVLNVHDAVHQMRQVADPAFTSRTWSAVLPGDKITIKELKNASGHISDVLWPSLPKQIFPRDAERLDMRTVRVGDRIYSTVYIDLFPKDVQPFMRLFSRAMQSGIPWRISFNISSKGMGFSSVRDVLARVLSFSSSQNRLIANSLKLLDYIDLNTDDAVVRLRVSASTWAPEGDLRTLRTRASILARTIEGWGTCDVSEVSGDPYQGAVSTMLGVSSENPAQASLAPFSNVIHMLPLFRPSSPWSHGALLFRSPDGKLWPYHPGSRFQTTFIDLFYARPGSGKSVLSNAMNLAVCLSPGIQRLPRIAIIDIGPSSSGLVSLLRDALPMNQKHYVASHRLQMSVEYSINPFDTQLGCRFPTPLERSFLVNFLCLLATPVGSDKSYDGVADMAGLIVDELYKTYADDGNPNVYSPNLELVVDGILEEIGFVSDMKTTWWEVTDALFMSGFEHEATLAQRQAMPVLADVTSICRTSAVEDLYGKIVAPTGEALIHSFSRMMSGAVREYPIISQATKFDLGDARVVSLDLDEVAKSGGDAANRQTAVMYMLARYILAKNFYLTEEAVHGMPAAYQEFHRERIMEIREDPKRLVYDEFHRTSSAKAVRDQVIVDMREGRKWKVQVALLSQSLDDFDSVMVEFATSVFIMEAGPEASVRKTASVFGLSTTAKNTLRNHVHGPRESGANFLAQFATKEGIYIQLLTSTLGPIELWALNTTAEDVNIRNQLYKRLGPRKARQVLAKRFPGGTAVKVIEDLFAEYQDNHGFIDDESKGSVFDELIEELIEMA